MSLVATIINSKQYCAAVQFFLNFVFFLYFTFRTYHLFILLIFPTMTNTWQTRNITTRHRTKNFQIFSTTTHSSLPTFIFLNNTPEHDAKKTIFVCFIISWMCAFFGFIVHEMHCICKLGPKSNHNHPVIFDKQLKLIMIEIWRWSCQQEILCVFDVMARGFWLMRVSKCLLIEQKW